MKSSSKSPRIVIIGLKESGASALTQPKSLFYEKLVKELEVSKIVIQMRIFNRYEVSRYPEAVSSSVLIRLGAFLEGCIRILPQLLKDWGTICSCWKVASARVQGTRHLCGLLLDFLPWYQRMVEFLKQTEGDRVLCWGAYHCAGRFMREHRSRFLELLFLEYGMLPGHILCDASGLNGESWVVRRNFDYSKLMLDDSDRLKARNYIQQVAATKTSNKTYDASCDCLLPEQARVLVAGIELFGAGILPRDQKESYEGSPLYEDNVSLLRDLCSEVGQNVCVVYKGHPNMDRYEGFLETQGQYVVAGKEDIFQLIEKVDVVVTLMSSVAQLALIAGKPVVLAGKNPMWGKGCTWEVNSRESIGEVVYSALAQGLTDTQRSAFVDYVARELKYVMYGIGSTGRDVSQFVNDLMEARLGYFPQ